MKSIKYPVQLSRPVLKIFWIRPINPSSVHKMTDTDDITGCRSKPDSFGSIIFLSWWRFGS